MKQVITIVFISIQLFCLSQNPMNEEFQKNFTPDNEEHIEYYKSGHLKYKYTKKNKNLEGEYLHFFKNGQIDDSSYFENGHYNGTNKLYNKKGKLIREERFKHDTLLYIRDIHYYKNGNMYFERYLSFNSDSLKTFPFLNSKVASLSPRLNWNVELSVKNLKSTGKYIEYFKSGKLSSEIPLINNISEGIGKGYYDDGSLYFEGTYSKDKEDGMFTYYSATGQITKIETWKEGKLIKTEEK